jgi:hypothetical protein
MPSMPTHKDSWNPECVIAQAHELAEPFSLIPVKLQNRKSVEAALCPSTDTEARFHGIPYFTNQRFSACNETARAVKARAAVGERKNAPPHERGAEGDDQSPLLRDQIRLCAPSSPSTRRA